jgi:hypothetical protein
VPGIVFCTIMFSELYLCVRYYLEYWRASSMWFVELPNVRHRQIPQIKTKHTHIHSFRDLCCHLDKKLTLGLLVPITLEVVPSTHICCSQHSCHFFNVSWKSCSVRVFSSTSILPWSPQLCRNGGLSVLSSIGETEKSKVGGGRQSCCFWQKNSLVRKEWGPLSLMSTIEELLDRKSSGSGLGNRDYGCRGSAALSTRHPSIHKSWD